MVSALENLMPLAILASEGVMKAIRTAFIDAIEVNFVQIFQVLSGVSISNKFLLKFELFFFLWTDWQGNAFEILIFSGNVCMLHSVRN